MDNFIRPPRPPTPETNPGQPKKYQVLLTATYAIKCPGFDKANEKLANATTDEEITEASKELSQYYKTHTWWQEMDEEQINKK